MRSLWRGAISFGLVHIPVRMYAATEDRDVRFRMLHQVCGTPIAYRRFCRTCGREVEPAEIASAYEYGPGQFVMLSPEELESLPAPSAKVIEITEFVDLAQIDPIYYHKTYFLAPADGGLKAYALLRRAMQESGRVAVARTALRAKESLCAVRVYGPVLALETMFWADEVRLPHQLEGLGATVAFSPTELDMAKTLIRHLGQDFQPEKHSDQRRAAVLELVEAKVAGRQVIQAPAPDRQPVLDLVEALRRSVEMTGGPPH